MLWTYWIIAGFALVIIEILMPTSFFFACIGIGAILAGAVTFFTGQSWIQWAVFLLGSVLSIYLIRPLVKPFFRHGVKKSNVDELIGKKAVIIEAINPPAFGMLKVSGELWRAQADEKIEQGTMVEISAVEGTKLKVRKI